MSPRLLLPLPFHLGRAAVAPRPPILFWSLIMNTPDSVETTTPETMRKEGNQCIALGAGVGGLGAAAAVVFGATCPLCFVVAPGLVGVGLYRRAMAKRHGTGQAVPGGPTDDNHEPRQS